MKVLVVGTGEELAASGITTMADQLVRSLAGMRHEPTRLVAGTARRRRPNRINAENLRAVLQEVSLVFRTTRSDRPAVVWLHAFGVPTLPALRTLAQVLVARMAGSPVIVHLHAFDLPGHVAAAGLAQRLVLRTVARLAAAVVVLDERGAAAIERLTQRRVEVLPNWVEVPPEPAPLPPATPFIGVFVGSLTARKGVTKLLAALRSTPDLPLRTLLVGGAGDDGPEAARAIRRGAQDLVAAGRVDLLGQADAAGVRAAILRSHFLVLPSDAEGLPMALLEALSLGRPGLVSAAGAMAEIVEEGACGLVLRSTEPQDIARGLEAMAADLDVLAARGVAGHALARRRFSEQAAVRRVEAILARATGGQD